MAKATILKTNQGVYLVPTTQCSNGAWWDAENCFKYCQADNAIIDDLQAHKLLSIAIRIGNDKLETATWYKNRENFIDVEIDIECDQSYQYDTNRGE